MPTQAIAWTSCPINLGAADGLSIRQQRGFQAILACFSSSHHFSTSMKVSVVALTVLIAAFCYQTSAAPRKSRLSPSFRSGNKRDVAAGTELPLRVSPSVPPSSVGSDPPTSCCFSYISRQLPRSFVKDYYETNSQCSQPAVVFITRKGREVCANPEEDWVQQYVNELELN